MPAMRPVLILSGVLLLLGLAVGALQMPVRGGPARLTVAAILPAVANDQTWSQALHEGLARHEREGRITYMYVENVLPADAERVMRRYAERAPDLVIAHSATYRDAAFRVASEFRAVNFAWSSSGSRDHDSNLAAYDTPFWEASYLAGLVAGHVTKTGRLGFVGGVPIPSCRATLNAFRDGAATVKPRIEVSPVYVGNFIDIVRAKALALTLADRGVDVISVCGSGPSRGVIEAVRERGIWAIGYVWDQTPLAPNNVLGSIIWDGYKGIGQLLTDMEQGRFRPAKYYSGKTKDGITTFKINSQVEAKLPRTAAFSLKLFIGKIERGEFDIPISFD